MAEPSQGKGTGRPAFWTASAEDAFATWVPEVNRDAAQSLLAEWLVRDALRVMFPKLVGFPGAIDTAPWKLVICSSLQENERPRSN